MDVTFKVAQELEIRAHGVVPVAVQAHRGAAAERRGEGLGAGAADLTPQEIRVVKRRERLNS